MIRNNRFVKLGISILLLFTLFSCQKLIIQEPKESIRDELVETGYYTSKEEVSLYIKTFEKLPNNYITKAEANRLGWDSDKGNLWEISNKKSIGGDRFYNREGLLPKDDNIQYFECDIDYLGGFRNSKRIVYSNNGYIYFTSDHYESFELLYEGD
jgi:ribonuclease T1